MTIKSHFEIFSYQSFFTIVVILIFITGFTSGQELKLDEGPAEPGEWGYHPTADLNLQVNPPSFSWRPQKGLTWEIECASDTKFKNIEYRAENLEFNVHYPPITFEPWTYHWWRYRGKDRQGRYTNWSETRHFSVEKDALAMPIPSREELLSRIPKTHPRLFMRPENLEKLRESAKGKMKPEYDRLVRQCERLLAEPPSTKEPPKYPEDMERGGEQWRVMWWGNRTYTIRALDGAATLAFTWLLSGQEKFGLEAKRILLECAKWDPKGSTGYRYNDEAGMPYAYYFSRTYTFLNDLLSEEEKQTCRNVMKIRGDEMYQHLYPRHLWRPYASHSNRAWHFLGEVGIAFLDEIEGADDWVWFAVNVFFNVYPVWSDDDGGWHEGSSYWSSYLSRFTWWADVMREAMGINAYDKPFFSQAGYYAMYLLPPGKVGGGFGDLTTNKTAKNFVPIMSTLAAQAQNGHWQWYVEQLGGPVNEDGYIGFIRGELPKVKAVPPDDLPTSRLFKGTGQAFMNTNLTDANNNVQVVFKSSPFGTQSHGYEANNSFLLWAYGKRLLIRSGYRDHYGSDHHRNWMWSTRSVNNITVNGQGQGKRTAAAKGKIISLGVMPSLDTADGEAGQAYGSALEKFKRTIIFVKPGLVIIYDSLIAKEPSTFEYWLHAVNEIKIENQHQIQVVNDNVVCDIDFLTPSDLSFKQTDQYDPNPRPRIKLREWHLTASTKEKKKQMEFVTLYRPHRVGEEVIKITESHLKSMKDGYILRIIFSDGYLTATLPKSKKINFGLNYVKKN